MTLVSAFTPEMTQQIHSFFAKGVISSHNFSTFGTASIAFFKSSGTTLCGTFTLPSFFLIAISLLNYEPDQGAPISPTAKSIQRSVNKSKRINPATIRCTLLPIFNLISSSANPNPNKSPPATIKSPALQFTSSVNCIATNGIKSKTTTKHSNLINLLMFIFMCGEGGIRTLEGVSPLTS